MIRTLLELVVFLCLFAVLSVICVVVYALADGLDKVIACIDRRLDQLWGEL